MNNILVIGDIILDKYTYGKANRINPEGALPLIDVISEDFKLGGAANVAANISSLHGKCDLLGLTGEDRTSKKIHKLCNDHKIKFYDIKAKQHTIIKQRFIETTYNTQLLRVDYDTPLTLNNYNDIEKVLKKKQYSYVIFSDYNKGIINRKLLEIVRKYQKNAKIYVDTKKSDIDIFGTNFSLKVNLSELENIIGHTVTDIETDIKEISKKILGDVIVTLSEKGFISYSFKNKEIYMGKNEPINIIDVSGAGDTFMAGLVYGDIKGNCLYKSSTLANKLAGDVLGYVGTTVIQK